MLRPEGLYDRCFQAQTLEVGAWCPLRVPCWSQGTSCLDVGGTKGDQAAAGGGGGGLEGPGSLEGPLKAKGRGREKAEKEFPPQTSALSVPS